MVMGLSACTSVSSDRLIAFGSDADGLIYEADKNAGTVKFATTGLNNSKSFGDVTDTVTFGIGTVGTYKSLAAWITGTTDVAAIEAGTEQAAIQSSTDKAKIAGSVDKAKISADGANEAARIAAQAP